MACSTTCHALARVSEIYGFSNLQEDLRLRAGHLASMQATGPFPRLRCLKQYSRGHKLLHFEGNSKVCFHKILTKKHAVRRSHYCPYQCINTSSHVDACSIQSVALMPDSAHDLVQDLCSAV